MGGGGGGYKEQRAESKDDWTVETNNKNDVFLNICNCFLTIHIQYLVEWNGLFDELLVRQ